MNPIRIGPRTYQGPPTIDGLMQWIGEIQREYARALETDLLAGEMIDDIDIVDDILNEQRRLDATRNKDVRRTLERITNGGPS